MGKESRSTVMSRQKKWPSRVHDSIVTLRDATVLPIRGGADSGQFCWIADTRGLPITVNSGRLESEEAVLAVNGDQVAGYTLHDVRLLVRRLVAAASTISLRTVPCGPGGLTKELREFLSTKYPSDSPESEIQTTVRDNLYLRTVPCTTRPPRPGEINGVDYMFLTIDEFQQKQRAGDLLEDGIYDGNYYGTPKPPCGAAKPGQFSVIESRQPPRPKSVEVALQDHEDDAIRDRLRNGDVSSGQEPALPNGWEKVSDPHYGTYYIDHANGQTQLERPTADPHQPPQSSAEVSPGQLSDQPSSSAELQTYNSAVGMGPQQFFTSDPNQLTGNFITTRLQKGTQGFGFTIIGGDNTSQEFLQIKSIIKNGQADKDGQLRTGDVLVYVNGALTLGYTHSDIVDLFQRIPVGSAVDIQVCRGYPLPFDPDDPNTEYFTTIAVQQPAPLYAQQPQAFFLTVPIVKGDNGFGFTITDDLYGQRVKQILDRQRCRTLQEGDVLVEINGIGTQGHAHPDIVHMLKECRVGQEAVIVVQRIPQMPAYAPAFQPTQPSVNHYMDVAQLRAQMNAQQWMTQSVPHLNGGAVPGRSRTPGPEMTSVQNRLDDPGFVDYQSVTMRNPLSQAPFEERPRPKSTGPELSAASPPYAVVNHIPTGPGDLVVTLRRLDTGFGFRIVGGFEEGSQVSVGFIAPSGAAAQDGRLHAGDEILAINGQSVQNSTHHHAVQLMSDAAMLGQVTLALRRLPRSPPRQERPQPRELGYIPHSSLGLGGPVLPTSLPPHMLPQSASPQQPALSNVLTGGPPLVEEAPISPSSQGSLSAFQPRRTELRSPEQQRPSSDPDLERAISVTVSRRDDEGFGFVVVSSVAKSGSAIGHIIEGSPAARCGQLKVGDRISAINGRDTASMPHGDVINLIKESGHSVSLSVIPLVRRSGVEELRELANGVIPHVRQSPSNEEVYSLELHRGARGFGFSIRGGSEFGNMPLFILRIAETGAAAIDGRLQVGDQILEMNGNSTEGMTHTDAIETITNGGSVVRLTMRRMHRPPPALESSIILPAASPTQHSTPTFSSFRQQLNAAR